MTKTIEDMEHEQHIDTDQGLVVRCSSVLHDYKYLSYDYARIVDNILMTQYGNRIVVPWCATLTSMQNAVEAVLESNEYRYITLLQSMLTDYNPINNYDMVEESEDTTGGKSGDDVVAHTTTYNGGKRKSDTHDDSAVTHNAVTTFDSQDFRECDRSTTDPHTTTISADPTEDSTVEDVRYTKHRLTRSGNIGVTTTQQMLQSSRELAKINFAHIVARDIIHVVCIGVWPDEEVET